MSFKDIQPREAPNVFSDEKVRDQNRWYFGGLRSFGYTLQETISRKDVPLARAAYSELGCEVIIGVGGFNDHMLFDENLRTVLVRPRK